MEKQQGYLTRCDSTQFQRSFEEEGFGRLLNDLSVKDRAGLKNKISGIFLHASGRRSYIFFHYMFKEFATLKKNMEYRVPLFGVKGAHKELTREVNYMAFYLCQKEDALGTGFFEHVFGTDYITEQEARTLTDPVPRLGEGNSSMDLTIRESCTDLVCKIVEKIWESQEKDPKSRFVIVMDQAEQESLELLRQVYLLIPQQLRLNMGFATNVEYSDIKTMAQEHGLPLHIFTMDREVYDGQMVDYGFPLVFFELDQAEKYSYNEKRLKSLKQQSRMMQPVKDICFGYAEKKVLDETDHIASFGHYEQILNKMCEPGVYWWTRSGLDSVEDLYRAYEDQKELMNIPVLKNQALAAFYSRFMQEKKYAFQLVQMLRDSSYPQREQYLCFMREALHFGKVLDATEELIAQMSEEKQQEVDRLQQMAEQLKAEAYRHEQEELAAMQRFMQTEQEKSEEALRKQQESVLADLRFKHEEDLLRMERELRKEKSEKEHFCREAEEGKQIQQELLLLQDKYLKSNQENAKLRRDLEAVSESKLQSKCRRLENERDRATKGKKISVILAVFWGLLATAGIAGTVISFSERSGLEQEIQEAEYRAEKMSEENDTMKAQIEAVEAEKEQLISEKQTLESENSRLETEKEQLELEKQMLGVHQTAQEDESATEDVVQESETYWTWR